MDLEITVVAPQDLPGFVHAVALPFGHHMLDADLAEEVARPEADPTLAIRQALPRPGVADPPRQAPFPQPFRGPRSLSTACPRRGPGRPAAFGVGGTPARAAGRGFPHAGGGGRDVRRPRVPPQGGQCLLLR